MKTNLNNTAPTISVSLSKVVALPLMCWGFYINVMGYTETKVTRKKIKPSERVKIFEKSNFTCNNCNYKFYAPPNYSGKNTIIQNGLWLEIDHIIPISRGGTDTLNNKQALCNVCNGKKFNKI